MLKKPETESQSFACSNEKCRRIFANPVTVQDFSSKDEISYQACPYCLTEVEIGEALIVGEDQKGDDKRSKERTKSEREEDALIKSEQTSPTSPKQHGCQNSFGYLSKRARDSEIPEECMICERLVECMLRSVA